MRGLASGLHEVEELWSLSDLVEAHELLEELDEERAQAERELERRRKR